MYTLSKTDDLLKIIGIGAIGVIGIGIVIFILSAMCVTLGFFMYSVQPDTPTVTISPYDGGPAASVGQNSPLPLMEHSIFDEAKTVPKGYYQYYSMIMDPGIKINVSVSTNGSPIDVMVMNSQNFGDYVSAVNSLSGGTWETYDSEKSVVNDSFKFISPGTDRYYIILDNTRSPEGGAYAGKDVDVQTVITSG